MVVAMRKVLEYISKNIKIEIIKVFSLTALSTIVKMITGLISVKVIAIILGPSGIALIGQLNSFTSILISSASGGINSGVTKYIAQYKESEEKVKKLLSTALIITMSCSLFCGVFLITFHRLLGKTILQSEEYNYVFVIFGLTIILYALYLLITSILNGYKEYRKFIMINIIGSILGLIFTLVFVFKLGLKGALIAAVSSQSITFFISIMIVRKSYWLNSDYLKNNFDKDVAKKYLQYSLMTICVAATPLSQLILRGFVISNISPIEAGWWESMNRISSIYLTVITSSFGIYYLPRLSEINNRLELKNEIFNSFKIIIPILLAGFALIYIFRIFIIKILFTVDFYPMEHFFVWQLFGDFLKISSWILAYIMVAKSMTKAFIFTEVLFSGLFILLGFILMNLNGVIGLTQAYFVNYLIYMLVMVVIFRKIIFS